MSKTDRVEARKLKGFRDFLPEQAKIRRKIISEVHHQAESYGFLRIDTPCLEYADVLLGSSNQETDKEVYRFTDHGKRDVALRFDLTVPFARFVSENFSSLKLPFKKLQIGDVWRGEKPQKGRYRQFCQADFDIVGVNSQTADIEVIQVIASCLKPLVHTPFTISLNDRSVLVGLIEGILGNGAKEAQNKILIALDKLDKIGEKKVQKVIVELGFDEQKVTSLLATLQITDSSALREKLSQLLGTDHKALNNLYLTYETLQKITADETCQVKINPSIARGLGYYTGVVFETTVDKLPGFGSIASGGRYDSLVARFGKHDLSGVGGSIGVDRLLAALEELDYVPEVTSQSVYVAVADEVARSYAFELATRLRSQNISTNLNVKPSKLGQQFKHADHLGCAFVITIGEDELSKKTFSIKRMSDGKEKHHIEIDKIDGIFEKLDLT